MCMRKKGICIEWAILYLVAVGLFLPLTWFCFDEGIATPYRGIDILGNAPGVVFCILTFLAILFGVRHAVLALFSVLFVWIQVVIYVYQFCFWYETYIMEFSWKISIDTTRVGFYLAFASVLLYAIAYSWSLRRKIKDNLF
ncbi:hypothetical protein lbkm_0064 [Lachnospiraceae bacterium KM106-2]|nr:hypothetical protein lbkm_0064 [Lachnospiraceae bacterium KM106-2]